MKKLLTGIIIRISLLALSLTLALILGEFFIRLFVPIPGLTETPKHFVAANKIGFKAGSNWEQIEPEFHQLNQINSLGFRDAEIDPLKNVIIFLGDSQTFGTGVNFGERFSDILKRKVSAHCPQYEVLNVSMPGASTFDELKLITHIKNLPLKIKHIYLGIVTNDHAANLQDERKLSERYSYKPKKERQSGFTAWIKKHRYNSRLLLFSLQALAKSQWFMNKYSRLKLDLGAGEFKSLQAIYNDEDLSRKQLDSTKRAILKIQEIAPTSLIVVPDRYVFDSALRKLAEEELKESLSLIEDLNFDREQTLLKEVSEDLNLEFLNPTLAFKEYANLQMLYYPLNGHLTKEGHSMLATFFLEHSTSFKKICPLK